MAKYGNWFENAQNVLAKIANINTAGTTFTGDVTGDLTGGYKAGAITTYTAAGAIALTDDLVILDGTSETAAMTLAVPGASNIGKTILVSCIDSTFVCDIDVITEVGSQTITFTVGEGALLVGTTGFTWSVVSTTASVA